MFARLLATTSSLVSRAFIPVAAECMAEIPMAVRSSCDGRQAGPTSTSTQAGDVVDRPRQSAIGQSDQRGVQFVGPADLDQRDHGLRRLHRGALDKPRLEGGGLSLAGLGVARVEEIAADLAELV